MREESVGRVATRWLRMVLAIGALALPGAAAAADAGAGASTPTFRITRLFSNLDGSLQFVELTEWAGQDGQDHLAGLTLTTTHGGVVKTFTFPSDLPTPNTANLTFVVAASEYGSLPVGSYGGGYNCCYRPAYRAPVRFLPTDGGSVDFAGVDRVDYASLPVDGSEMLDRDGTVEPATLPANGDCLLGVGCLTAGRVPLAQAYTFAVEYYDAARDHYFLSASAPDLDALDSGRIAGWARTGARYYVGAAPGAYPGLDTPVCRFYLPPAVGDSHFFSASADECATVARRFPDFVLETDHAFYVALPDPATGACPADLDFNGAGMLVPMYRLWNGRADTNHRYTTSAAVRAEMEARGWIAEGVGPDAVAFCVP